MLHGLISCLIVKIQMTSIHHIDKLFQVCFNQCESLYKLNDYFINSYEKGYDMLLWSGYVLTKYNARSLFNLNYSNMLLLLYYATLDYISKQNHSIHLSNIDTRNRYMCWIGSLNIFHVYIWLIYGIDTCVK